MSVNILNKYLLVLIAAVILIAGIGVTYFVFLQPKIYTVTLSKIGNGEVYFYPGGGYLTAIQVNAGTVITIKAIPNSGYKFNGWTGDYVGTETQVSLNVDRDLRITGVFIPE